MSGFFGSTDKVCLTTPVSREHLKDDSLICNAPGIFQENIPKQVELRITVIGRKIFAVEIQSQDHKESTHDWRGLKAGDLHHCPHDLLEPIQAMYLRFLDHFDLAYGAIDMILTADGEYIFLENNPSGQFGWIEKLTGLPLTATLAELLIAGRLL